jgi:hypothetical protein
VTELGVILFEAHLADGTGTCVYDSSEITTEQMLGFLAERAGNWPATLVGDTALSEA